MSRLVDFLRFRRPRGARARSAADAAPPPPRTDGEAAPPPAPDGLDVRVYPDRVGRNAPPVELTPSQAIHLPQDPRRAEEAARTGRAERVSPPSPAPGGPGRSDPATVAAGRGGDAGDAARRTPVRCPLCGLPVGEDATCPLGHVTRSSP